MDQQTASKLLEENLQTIYAWSFSKLYDKSEAEDLANDIILAVLKSVSNLKNDEAFYGFMWRIAENVLHEKIRKSKHETTELNETFCGSFWETPEDKYIEQEQLNILRRELSLLSNLYRNVTVQYYIYGKSCAQISSSLSISKEMVKYYLFKTRKILREGIGMTREFGEKSYNPQVFKLGFWGGNSTGYWELFERKLPGNILLSAYDKPMTISELSIELGVAAVYLEDEIKILASHDIIKKVGNKYQTNIIIFNEAYQHKCLESFKPIYKKYAEIFNNGLEKLMSTLKELDFWGNTYDDNCMKWTFANIALYHALNNSDKAGQKKFGDYPMLSNGSYGFLFGYDNDYKNHHFNGIYGCCENKEKTAWVSIENYRIIERCQYWQPVKWGKSISAMTDAVLLKTADENNEQLIRLIDEGVISSENGKISPNFPVFKESVFEKITRILEPVINVAEKCMEEICLAAEKILIDYVPPALTPKCGQLTQICCQMDVMALIIEAMVDSNQLTVPNKKINLCMFGVDKT